MAINLNIQKKQRILLTIDVDCINLLYR